MTEKISTLDVRKRLGDILNRVALRHDEFIIERKGVPLAAVVPIETLNQLRNASKNHMLAVLKAQQGSLSQAEADQIANEAKHKSRTHRSRKP